MILDDSLLSKQIFLFNSRLQYSHHGNINLYQFFHFFVPKMIEINNLCQLLKKMRAVLSFSTSEWTLAEPSGCYLRSAITGKRLELRLETGPGYVWWLWSLCWTVSRCPHEDRSQCLPVWVWRYALRYEMHVLSVMFAFMPPTLYVFAFNIHCCLFCFISALFTVFV